jgi:hypothetical protein
MLKDLSPILRVYGDTTTHPSPPRYNEYRLTYPAIICAVLLPSMVVYVACYFTQVEAARWWNDKNDLSAVTTNKGLSVVFTVFVLLAFLLALQLVALMSLAHLYTFRLRLLLDILQRKDIDVCERECSDSTPVGERALLVTAPSHKDPFSGTSSSLLIPTSPRAPHTESGSTHSHLELFLRVYRAIQEETSSHALVWSAPLILFIASFSYIFVNIVLSVIRDMAKNGVSSKNVSALPIIYLILALAYLCLNLVPVININSAWPGLMASASVTWIHWSPQERTVLQAYFTEHPVVFPVLFLTFTWRKVL